MPSALPPVYRYTGRGGEGQEGLGKLLPSPPARTRPPGSGPAYGARTVLELYFAGFGRYFPGNTV